jgi:hypothetical protein
LEELNGPPAERQDDEISEEDNDDSSVQKEADEKLDGSATTSNAKVLSSISAME